MTKACPSPGSVYRSVCHTWEWGFVMSASPEPAVVSEPGSATAERDGPGTALAADRLRAAAALVCRDHGLALHLVGCALLGDSNHAELAVAQAVSDFCGRVGPGPTSVRASPRRELARDLYRRCTEAATTTLSSGRLPSGSLASLPPAMVWLRQISVLQRTTLALCLFGGHTYREAPTCSTWPRRTWRRCCAPDCSTSPVSPWSPSRRLTVRADPHTGECR